MERFQSSYETRGSQSIEAPIYSRGIGLDQSTKIPLKFWSYGHSWNYVSGTNFESDGRRGDPLCLTRSKQLVRA